MYSIDDLVERFSGIGATFQIDDEGAIREPQSGFVVGNGRSSFTVTLSPDLGADLAHAFTKVINLVTFATEYSDLLQPDPGLPGYGLWLDYEATPAAYLFESVRVIDNVDTAIDYAIKHDQRYIYDLALNRTIEIAPAVIEVP